METHRGRTEEPAAVSWTTTDKFSLSLHQLLPFGGDGVTTSGPGAIRVMTSRLCGLCIGPLVWGG